MPKKEEIYTDELMNQGVNTDDSIRNIGTYQCSDVQNVRMGVKGGIYSASGKEAVNSATGFGAYLTCRGGIHAPSTVGGTEYAMVAQDNGAETAVFAIEIATGTVTQLTETTTENSLTTGKRVFFTFADDKYYWKVEGESSIYVWDGNLATAVSTITAASGSIPTSTKLIESWKSRLWLGNDSSNPSEITACAYRDYDWWNTATANVSGDKAYQAIPDARQDEQLIAIVANAFDTLVMLRERSVFVLIGSNESDWEIHPLTLIKGCVSTLSAVRGNQAVWFLSQFGIERITGSLKVSDSNSYDSLISSTITADNQDAFNSYSTTEKTNSFATIYRDTYRLNIDGDVWVFDLLSNNYEGALTKVGVEGDIAVYINSGDVLYGMGATDGILYKLDTGDNDNGNGYEKYYITKDHDMGLPRNLKNFPEIRVFGRLDSDYDLYCDVYLNGADNPATTLTFSLVDVTDDSYYIFDKGTSTSVGAGSLTDNTKAWVADAYIGGYLMDSNSSLYPITDNDATTITVTGNPAAGAYYLLPNTSCFYTLNADSGESWASFYQTVDHVVDSGNKISLRGKSIRLKFYNNNADEPFEIYKYQIVYEVLPHTSPNDRT